MNCATGTSQSKEVSNTANYEFKGFGPHLKENCQVAEFQWQENFRNGSTPHTPDLCTATLNL